MERSAHESFIFEFLDIINASLSGTKVKPSDLFDMEHAYRLAVDNQILPLLFYGLVENCVSSEIYSRMQKAVYQIIYICESQNYLAIQVFRAFEENQIDYLPLKGLRLRQLYPCTEMRTMGDLDILIRVEQYNRISQVMRRLKFTEIAENDYEFIWIRDKHKVELHKQLISSYNNDYCAYYGDGWHIAKQDERYRYMLDPEDELIYLITHFAKHYRDGGIGVRAMIDLHVFRLNFPNLDRAYIKEQLEKLQLLKFYDNILNTLECWFRKSDYDEISKFITLRVFNSGTYGDYYTHKISEKVKNGYSGKSTWNIRLHHFIELIFPCFAAMSQIYPFLIKTPVLLPVMWIYRLADALLHRRKKICKHVRTLLSLNARDISKHRDELIYVGLNFNSINN